MAEEAGEEVGARSRAGAEAEAEADSHVVFHWDEDEDDQTTPRASQAGVSQCAESRRLSRDDTAADVSMFDPAGSSGEASKPRRYTHYSDPYAQFNAWAAANGIDLNGEPSQQRGPSQRRREPTEYGGIAEYPGPAVRLPSQHAIPGPCLATVPPVNAVSAVSVDKKSRFLSRRWSKTYKEKMDGLKEQIKHQASLTGRTRRASTPLNAEPARYFDPGQMAAPVSPSKRNALHGSEARMRKFRSPIGLITSDRKDTPAPVPTNVVPTNGLVARPAPAPVDATAPWPIAGGDSARKAAAATNSGMAQSQEQEGGMEQSHEQDVWSQQQTRNRQRVGSLSSAADSGADLGTFGEDSCPESVDEVDGMDMEPEEEEEEVVRADRLDFVELLPSEIALEVFTYLDARDLFAAQCVGPAWKEMAGDPTVWRASYNRTYGRQVHSDPAPIAVGGLGVGRHNVANQEWKRMYKARLEVEKNWRKGAKHAGKAIYLSGHTDSVYCLQFDETKIITGSRDRTIRVWDINSLQCLRVIGGPNVRPVLGPKVLRTVDYPAFHLATASTNGTHYGEQIYETPAYWHDASILCLQYDDEILVTGSSDYDLIVWDIHTYKPLHRLRKHSGGVLDVALDSKHIVSCSKDSRIIVWNRQTFELKGDLTGHRGPVNAVQLRGKFLVSASGDGIARLWDLEQMKLIQEFSAKERGLAAVEFSEDMKYVLAGGNDHITYKFEVATGNEVKQFTGHTQLVRSLWLDSANNRVVSGSYDLDLRVYDFVTGQEIWRAEEWTTSWMLAAKSDYRRIVATSQDGRILIVDFGLIQGGLNDGQPIEDVDLLRGVPNPHAIIFRNPWCANPGMSRLPSVLA
ncbi:hypothetical protein LTR08_001884 [Meristemomyces frigidus]|nr:hypothetical protein LTR08_001884 [Meristemomyces frigidus]